VATVTSIITAPITCTLGPAINTERTLELRAHVLALKIHPMASVIPRTVPITYTLAHATNTKRTSVVRAVVLVVENQVLTATTIHALFTPTSVHAISTEITSVQVHVLGLDQAVTATTFHAPVTHISVPATSTEDMTVTVTRTAVV